MIFYYYFEKAIIKKKVKKKAVYEHVQIFTSFIYKVVKNNKKWNRLQGKHSIKKYIIKVEFIFVLIKFS